MTLRMRYRQLLLLLLAVFACGSDPEPFRPPDTFIDFRIKNDSGATRLFSIQAVESGRYVLQPEELRAGAVRTVEADRALRGETQFRVRITFTYDPSSAAAEGVADIPAGATAVACQFSYAEPAPGPTALGACVVK